MNTERKHRDDTKKVIKAIGQGATSAVVLQGRLLFKVYQNTIGALWDRFQHANVVGKILVLLGLAGCIAAGYYAYQNAITASFEHQDFVLVTQPKVNVRETPSAQGALLVQLKKGERLTPRGESQDKSWWAVQDQGWRKLGWVAKDVTTRQNKSLLRLTYVMDGYGLGFFAAFVLMYIGFCLRRSK